MEYRASYVDSLQADILPSYKDSLTHHGILGQKWGIRRFQNPDGTLTKAGKKRYDKTAQLMKEVARYDKAYKNLSNAGRMRNASKVKHKADSIRRKLDPDMVARVKSDRAEAVKKKREARKPKQLSREEQYNQYMKNSIKQVFGKDAKVDYMNIYKEMSKDKRYSKLLDSDDPGDYRRAEAAWLKKHGLYDGYKKLMTKNETPRETRSRRMSEVYVDHPNWTADTILGKKYQHLKGPHSKDDKEYWDAWNRAMDERLTELGY